jgi:hypothetical protein
MVGSGAAIARSTAAGVSGIGWYRWHPAITIAGSRPQKNRLANVFITSMQDTPVCSSALCAPRYIANLRTTPNLTARFDSTMEKMTD